MNRDLTFFHHCEKPFGGFDTKIRTTGFGNGDSSETLITFYPDTKKVCFIDVGKNLSFNSSMEDATEPLSIRLHGDSEMETFYDSICFLKEIFEGFLLENQQSQLFDRRN